MVLGNFIFSLMIFYLNHVFIDDRLCFHLQTKWCMLVTVEDDFISEICDVPQMSTNALLFFHIYKRHNQIPVHEDKYSVWSARASLSGLEMPPAVGSLCRSGPQFIAYSNPIMLYEAAVGTSPSAPDAVDFTPVSFTFETIFI